MHQSDHNLNPASENLNPKPSELAQIQEKVPSTPNEEIALHQQSIGGRELASLGTKLDTYSPEHLRKFPFRAPEHVEQKTAWFEGSFSPPTRAHLTRIQEIAALGFGTIIIGIVPKNYIKTEAEIAPLAHRHNMLIEMLKHEGFPLVESPSGNGVHVTKSAIAFHTQRYKSWLADDRFIFMGADNFCNYYGGDKPWDQLLPEVAVMRKLTRFRTLYNNLFAERLLVFDKPIALHAKDVRNGASSGHPVVDQYLEKHKLFKCG